MLLTKLDLDWKINTFDQTFEWVTNHQDQLLVCLFLGQSTTSHYYENNQIYAYLLLLVFIVNSYRIFRWNWTEIGLKLTELMIANEYEHIWHKQPIV